ncbi:O-antigen ligase family protein [candidate division KSB1 bacterium]|nr:O-antigen ligase family protein [candidate division KSB1 bacterium]
MTENSFTCILKREWLFFLLLIILFYAIDGHSLHSSLRGKGSLSVATDVVNEGRMERKLGFFILFGIAMLSLFRNNRKSIRIDGYLGWLVILFFVWIIHSLAWSDDFSLTLRRVIVIVFIATASFAFAERFTMNAMMIWLFLATLIYSIFGLLTEISLSTFVPLQSDYRFAGTLHPNHQGMNCALTIISGLCLYRSELKSRKLILLSIAIAFILLFLTKSRTSFVGVILVLLIYAIFVFTKTLKISIIFISIIAFCLLTLFAGDVLLPAFEDAALMGREEEPDGVASLTGRTPLWTSCLSYINQRPLQGYGYGAFWTDQRIARISAQQNWVIGESHNAYIEIALQLGIIGGIIYIVLLFGGFIRAVNYFKLSSNMGYLFISLVLLFCIFNGFLESGVVFPSMIMFLCLSAFMYMGFNYE